jgi:hypothetical protein
MKACLKYVVSWVAGIAVAVVVASFVYLRFTAAPIRPIQVVQPVGTAIPLDARIYRVVRRAQLDYFAQAIPEVGRTFLRLSEARSEAKEIQLWFWPAGALDIFVLYSFSTDGKML